MRWHGRDIDEPVSLVRALKHLPANARQRDLASIEIHLRDNLCEIDVLDNHPIRPQPAMCPNSQQWRFLRRLPVTQNSIPRTFRRTRRKPFDKARRRQLIGAQIKLKYTALSYAVSRRRH